ncbi:TPA: efflux RND transporter permease subunit, partial [Stenotrophomonas maltophilia]|nr:efflux RND transporter permease subunit [Stenotrophomonas maltophilia]
MRRFNLSEWALANRPLVLFAMLAFALIGAWSYKHLGQSEDPPFTFKAMVVRTLWPGATAEQVSRQVTEPIEKALMNTGEYEFIRSYSRPGESQVIFMARDSLRSKQIPDLWYQVRKRVGDIRPTLPREIVGPFFNDEFGDTYGNIYALTGKGFDYAVMRDYADRIQLELQRVPDVGKIDLVGLQDEKVWIELSNTRLATLGVSMQQVQQALADQNAVTGTSFFETATDRVQLRVTGQFNDIDAIRQFPIRAGDRTVHLGDIAEVKRGFADPASPKMRFMGEEAIGLAVAMKDGGDILKLGANLDAEFERLQKTLPAGMQLRKVSDQPQSVEESVGEFVQVLTEAVVIVLLVSFFSLGLRTGLVVGVTIPLVLAMTFFVMHYFDIGLHKISLGALVLALGLLVDDAIIAVEMMATKMEQGYDRLRAASFAWESTAFPMLTGTLITAAGFLPIATAASSTGEYTRSLFQVVTIALVVSWIAAVLFIPYLGDKMLPDLFNPQPPKPGSLSARWLAKRQQWADRYPALANLIAPPQHGHDHDPYQRPFYRSFRRFLDACLRHRWWVIAATIGLFVFSLMMFRFVPQQFFPDSTRPELMVDIELAEGASLRSTQAQAEKLEKLLSNREGIANYVSYVGTGSPRFYLPLDQQLPATNFAQFVVLAKDIKSRESTRDWLLHEVIPKFPDVQMRVTRLENGPPVGYPVQMRISGEHIEKVQAIARQVEAKVRGNPHVMNVNLDWSEPSKVVRLVIDQERARALGVSSAQVSQFLSSSLAGQSVSVYREGNRQIEMLLRGPADERNQLELLSSLSMPTANGSSITLSQVATMEYGFEDGIIWHRNRLPTVTVRADISDGMQPLDVVHQILPTLDGIRAELPSGYLLETGGTVEDSARGQNSIKAGMPLFLVV